MSLARVREAGYSCNQQIQSLSAPKSLGWTILVFILLLSAACGGQKARVKPPLPRPVSTPASNKAETVKGQTSSSATTPVVEPTPQPSVPEQPAVAAVSAPPPADFAPGPPIRIGLTTAAKEIRIASPGDYYIMEKAPEAARLLVHGQVQIRLERGNDESSVLYRVQVASLTNAEAAEDLKSKLVKAFSVPVVIRENADTGTNQVRIGEFATQEDAQPLLGDLGNSGYRDAYLVKETDSSKGSKSALALRGSSDLFRLSTEGFLIQPSSAASYLSLDGKPYRGLLDVFLNKGGRITVVNLLGTEEYLLGVVPAEIPPSRYPEFDALAAMAIASRTYALHNLGRYKSEGFDLTADTNTQVYGGVAVEEDATDEAVHKTAGLAIYYQDKLIDAMYMSTCGGRTEDFSNVYDAPEVPYLKSVFCAIESGPEKGATTLEGSHELEQSVFSDDGSVANRNIELARILGVTEARQEMSPDSLAGPAKKDEIVQWVDNARKLAYKNRSNDSVNTKDIETRAGFLRYAAESFFGTSEIRRKISTRDVAYYMDNLKDAKTIPEAARYALTYLVRNGLWQPSPDNTVHPDSPMLRSDALYLLVNWIEAVQPDILGKGTFVTTKQDGDSSASNSTISVKRGKQTQELHLSEKLHLFRLDSGRSIPVASLKILGNEKLVFYTAPSGVTDFLEVELNPNGASSDRYSPAANWDVTLAKSVVAERLRNLTGNIGQFKDMEPSRLGSSGRAVRVRVSGTRGSVEINGYKVRGALGLKDTLYTLTREFSPDGSISSFTFHGRGFGHGVGLCQVGAFGMARAGHSYEEILKTYYQGVEIRKAF